MKALDQAFIKAYLHQAGEAKEALGSNAPNRGGTPGPEGPARSTELSASGLAADSSGVQSRASSEGGSRSPSSLPTEWRKKSASSGRKAASRSVRVSLTEALNPEDQQTPVGLPNRKTIQQLASGDSQTGASGVPRPHFLSRGRRTHSFQTPEAFSPRSGREETPSESASLTDAEPNSEPECILDFTASSEQKICSSEAEEAKVQNRKLPKNPRKITLRDLEIPREVCLFEPPSPTIPLRGEEPRGKGRGRPELARPAKPPRLTLFAPEPLSEASSRIALSGKTEKAGRQDAGPGVPLAGAVTEGNGAGGAAAFGGLCVHGRSEGIACPKGEKAKGEESPSGQPVSGGACRPVCEAGLKSFSPHWRVGELHWPPICLALEVRASAALDRVAEAIRSAMEEGKKIFGFLSLRAGEGATTLLLSAARRLAGQGCQLLLADANLLHPDLADRLNLAPQTSWEEVAEGRRSLEEVLIACSAERITILPRRSSIESGAALSARLWGSVGASLSQLRPFYEVILVDLGAWEHLLETPILKGARDSAPVEALVMVRNVRIPAGRTDLSALRGRLQAAGMPVIGIVDNCV